jgi:hypothetical protein
MLFKTQLTRVERHSVIQSGTISKPVTFSMLLSRMIQGTVQEIADYYDHDPVNVKTRHKPSKNRPALKGLMID